MWLIKEYEHEIQISNKRIKKLKVENIGCFSVIVPLIAISFINNIYFGGLVFFSSLIFFVNHFTSNNEEIFKLKDHVEDLKNKIQKEIDHENYIRIQKERTIFEEDFKVRGITKYDVNLNELLGKLIRLNFNNFAEFTNKEIEEFGERIYKYSECSSENIKFVKEPTNEYDKNAIKIYVENLHIGYVPRELNETIGKYVDNRNYSIISSASIIGGPYKEFNYLEDRVITNKEQTFGIEIHFMVLTNNY